MKWNSGQSLIEVLIALAISALVILGLVKVTTTSMKNAGYSQDQTRALGIAQQKAGEIIALKNDNPLTFFQTLPSFADELSSDKKFCLQTTLTDISGEVLGNPPAGSKMVKINIDVFWTENVTSTRDDCQNKEYVHKFQLETKITN